MILIYYIDTEDLEIKTRGVDNRLTIEELDELFGDGLWFENESDAKIELDVILFNLE